MASRSAAMTIICPSCGSGLLRPEPPTGRYSETQLRCRACGGTVEAEAFISKAIEDALAFDMYLTKEGAKLPYVSCPECGTLAYVVEEERCAFCGHKAEDTCIRCSNPIPPGEQIPHRCVAGAPTCHPRTTSPPSVRVRSPFIVRLMISTCVVSSSRETADATNAAKSEPTVSSTG